MPGSGRGVASGRSCVCPRANETVKLSDIVSGMFVCLIYETGKEGHRWLEHIENKRGIYHMLDRSVSTWATQTSQADIRHQVARNDSSVFSDLYKVQKMTKILFSSIIFTYNIVTILQEKRKKCIRPKQSSYFAHQHPFLRAFPSILPRRSPLLSEAVYFLLPDSAAPESIRRRRTIRWGVVRRRRAIRGDGRHGVLALRGVRGRTGSSGGGFAGGGLCGGGSVECG